MSRWLAPLLGGAGLLALVAGLLWTEWRTASLVGTHVALAGIALLLLGLLVLCAHEAADAVRRHGQDRAARRG